MRYYTAHFPRALNRATAAEGEGTLVTSQALGSAILVSEGFNWLAFFFSIPWALVNRLWFTALAMATALALIVGLPEIFAPDWRIRAVLLIGYAVICGFGSNDWRRLGLAQNGWELVNVVAARDRAQAFLRLAYLIDDSEEPEGARQQATPPAGPRLDLGPNPGFWS